MEYVQEYKVIPGRISPIPPFGPVYSEYPTCIFEDLSESRNAITTQPLPADDLNVVRLRALSSDARRFNPQYLPLPDDLICHIIIFIDANKAPVSHRVSLQSEKGAWTLGRYAFSIAVVLPDREEAHTEYIGTGTELAYPLDTSSLALSSSEKRRRKKSRLFFFFSSGGRSPPIH